MNDNFNVGISRMQELIGDHGVTTLFEIQSKFPDLAQYIAGFAYGDIYVREGLHDRDKSLIVLSILVAQGAQRQLDMHYRMAFNLGFSVQDIVNVLIHCIPYTGIPKVMDAFAALEKVTDELGIQVREITQ
jgi:4-carboxymuconolactone decarboxylase